MRYRSEATSTAWETDAQLAAWARPRGTVGWPFAVLVYLSFRDTTMHNRAGMHSGFPRWRWSWVIFSPELIEPVQPYVPSEYWADSCSAAIEELVTAIGRPRRDR